MRKLLLTFCGLLSLSVASAEVSGDAVFLTAKDSTARLSPVASLVWGDGQRVTEKREGVFVDPNRRFQAIVGIGGAITDAAAETLAKLPADRQDELIRAYYDPIGGIGYTLARTSIHSCDFSSSSYTYVRDGDAALESFSVGHDEKYRLPLLRRAIAAAGGKLVVFASPWSPPAWMKDNGSMLHGGRLKPEFRAAWARYYARFVQAYAKAGVPIWGLTVQNEPLAVQKWESCVYSAEEERDFIKDFLGPELRRSGLGGVKIIAWDHNRTLLYPRARAVLEDPDSAKYVWGIAYHWYVNDSYENVRLVKASFPEAHLMLSEGCNGPYSAGRRGDWDLGEKYGAAMIQDFNAGAEAWTDWNILLDEEGGPNHVGNFCFAPVHGDTRTGELFFGSAYYYLGHFSKFIRPGARRIVSSTTTDRLLTTAFRNADGGLAVVVMNPTEASIPFSFWVGSRSAQEVSPPRSILTAVIR